MKPLTLMRNALRQWRGVRRRADDLDRKLQMVLINQYKMMPEHRRPFLAETEFSSYSQNGEDGTLLYLFSLVGAPTKIAVELCAGDGVECNAANLILNHGWSGLLFDGDPDLIEQGRKFYATRTNAWRTTRLPPRLVHAWITAENVDQLIVQNGVDDEIDLLSLDLDGVDYWIWKEIRSVRPRVVVLEFNNRFGAEEAVTVPYAPDFRGLGASVEGEGYFGASLAAFEKLGREKGYRLIGANSPNTNAYFMRNDVGADAFPAVSVADCLSSTYAVHQRSTKKPGALGELITV